MRLMNNNNNNNNNNKNGLGSPDWTMGALTCCM